jgi:hypothetical protein
MFPALPPPSTLLGEGCEDHQIKLRFSLFFLRSEIPKSLAGRAFPMYYREVFSGGVEGLFWCFSVPQGAKKDLAYQGSVLRIPLRQGLLRWVSSRCASGLFKPVLQDKTFCYIWLFSR